MMPRIIALTGPKGVGKSLVASQLRDALSATILSYADPIRDALKAIGVCFDGDKEAVQQPFGRSARFMAQTFGTDWGRDMVSQSIWLDVMAGRIESTDGIVIIDDARFDNEARQVESLGGLVVELYGDTCYKDEDGHKSEMGISPFLVDCVVHNSRINTTAAMECILSSWKTK